MPRRRATWLALALLCLWAAAPVMARAAGSGADDDDDAAQSSPAAPRRSDGYPIVLTRPMKVGQSYAWVADATVVESVPGPVSAAGSSTVNETVSVHLDGVVQILAVDAEGDVTEMACTVNECTARSGKERKFVVQPGRVILVEAGKWKSKLTATSGNLTLQDEPLLRAVLSLPRLGEPSDDEVFGTAKRQNVGDTWNIRADPMVRSWAAAGYKIKPQNVSGSMKVKSAEVVDGVECVRVAGRAKIEHFLPPGLDIPDGVEVGDATTELKFTKLLPADPSKHVLVDSHSMSVRFVLKKDPRSLRPEAREGRILRSVGVKLMLLPG